MAVLALLTRDSTTLGWNGVANFFGITIRYYHVYQVNRQKPACDRETQLVVCEHFLIYKTIYCVTAAAFLNFNDSFFRKEKGEGNEKK